jgi:Cu(I)/Ag(I) efflux system membrane protein CusA/SilA
MVFTGVFIAFAGGFIMIGLYDTSWFLDFELFGTNMRELFQIRTVNLSVAVWVGFLALFGIATDDGVLVATFLRDSFKRNKPDDIAGIRDAVVEGGLRRVRPAMMTTATTILALLPVLTSTGRGADIMLPMAIPSFGGMTLQMITMFTVPVLYSLWQEWSLRIDQGLSKPGKWGKFLGIGLVLIFGFSPMATAQNLPQLSEQIREANPSLKMLQTEHQAALERILQVGQLPDPEVGIGVFPMPVETRLGAQQARLSATQMFPWFGTLSQKESVEAAKAAALYERIDVQALNLIYEGEQAYYKLYEIQRSQIIIQENIDILRALEQLSLAKVKSGSATAADVLRVQLKIEELTQELSILQTAEAAPLATINQLRNQPVNAAWTIDDSLSFAILPFDKDTLLTNISAYHPMIRMLNKQQDVAREALTLNTLNGKPSFGVGLDYIAVGERTDALPENNGRDILQMRATVKIPLFREQYAAKEREENLRIQALSQQEEATIDQFAAQIEQAYTQHETARLQYELYEQQIEITAAAIRILRESYSADGSSFDELLRLESELINYDLKKLRATVQSHLAKSSIQRFIIQ